MDKLIEYAIECRKRGFNDEYIRNTLRNANYQDAIIEQALARAGFSRISEKRNFSMNLKPIVALIMILAVGISAFGIYTMMENNVTGYAVQEKSTVRTVTKAEAEKIAEASSLLEAKNRIISEQIEKINLLDISLEEKQKLIQEKTIEVENLFKQIESERKENLESSIELINSILARKV